MKIKLRKNKNIKQLRQIARTLSSPALLHYVLLVLMLYLVAGTVAQKYIGLYEATNIFFSSFIFWLGPFPLPGLPIFMGLMIINLCFKLVLKSPWTIKNSGIIITHISVLLLLFGGLLTMLMSEEGYIDIAEGERKDILADYHIRDFVILDKEGNTLKSFLHKNIAKGDILDFPDLPFQLKILTTCQNCEITARDNTENGQYFGMAKHMQLSNAALRHKDEMNMAGLVFELKGTDNSDGVHLVLEEILKWPKFKVKGQEYQLVLRKQRRKLPFTIELMEFTRELHPGTSMAKSYQSRVRIYDGEAKWESLISMNEPLRYKGYTFFQSSFMETPNGDVSVLAVVLNAGRTFPYISGIMLCIGLLVHLWARRRKPEKTVTALLLLFFTTALFPSQSQAYDVESFAKLPILHDGRIKPIDSFAKANLKKLSGNDNDALIWLIETIFNPSLGETKPVLKITNPDVLNILDLEKRKDKLYSYKEISAALAGKQEIILSIVETLEEKWTPAQKDLILLQQNMVSLGDILTSLTPFLPINIILSEDMPEDLKPYVGKALSYIDILNLKENIDVHLAAILSEKGENIDTYSSSEQQLVYLSFAATKLEETGAKSRIFRIFPNDQNKIWQAPWGYILNKSKTPATSLLFEYWENLALAYHNNDTKTWDDLTGKIYDETIKISNPVINANRLRAELIYNQLEPFKLSAWLYVLCLFLLGAAFLKRYKYIIPIALGSLYLGAAFHLTGIGLRMFILGRAPVSTLYESIIFVGLVAVLYGIWAYTRKREKYWLYIAAGVGVFLHLVGFSHNQDGDSLLMLSAVLNTNFWLSVHVICITIGYAFCLIASVIAHYILGRAVISGKFKPEKTLFENLHIVALLALLFSAIGTVLGGIWADQSWGRFWGWDPKENGALLIVMWLIWILHGRISAQMNNIWFTAGLAYTSVIIALSWFGVNLLGVGLHSYGFTDSAIWSLTLFIGVETLIIGAFVWLIHQNKRKMYVR